MGEIRTVVAATVGAILRNPLHPFLDGCAPIVREWLWHLLARLEMYWKYMTVEGSLGH